jgi:hypothetical protein
LHNVFNATILGSDKYLSNFFNFPVSKISCTFFAIFSPTPSNFLADAPSLILSG